MKSDTAPPAVHKFRCGDTARIEGQKFDIEIAYADEASNRASWCGWPEGTVEITKLTLVRACTDEEHARAVAEWLDRPRSSESDHRRGMIEMLYRPRAYWRSVCAQIQSRIDGDNAALARAASSLADAESGPEDVKAVSS